ncbi:MAG: A24 family peptidase [Rouxiella aceris]|uniref:A24 family peptidase n=1 Tax=Rouxiella aceris TaxID=2703884 RepID=UPI00284858E3|nr:A24 family peptidase [Rouxiella aceris]MDR3430727.1 A24 family peptidase [Rouxiella aceris]
MTEPVTVLTIVGPWPLSLPLFCLALLGLRVETAQVKGVMTEYGHHAPPETDALAIKQHIWLHAAAMCAIVMLSSLHKPFELMTSIFFVLFIFRMSLIDALTGWLPREFTWPFTAAGLCVAWAEQGLLPHAFTSLILLVLGWLIRQLGERCARREVLGLGDVWLTAGLGAWFGLPLTLFSLMGGLVGFVLWYAGSREASRGGPLGPWLGYSALLCMAFNVSEPLLMW